MRLHTVENLRTKENDALMKITFLLIIVSCFITGCNLNQATPVPTPTSLAIAPNVRIAQVETQTTPIPTQDREARVIPTMTATQTPQPIPTETDCPVNEEKLLPNHQIVAEIDYQSKTVFVLHSVQITNQTDTAWDTIAFNVEPNSYGGAFEFTSVNADDQVYLHSLDGNRLDIILDAPLEPNCETTLIMQYIVRPPQISAGITAFKGFFGYSIRQMNLSHWLPAVAPFRNGEWIVNPHQPIGEQIIREQANWDVILTVNNANGDLKIAASGQVTQLSPNSWQYIFERARDFPVSLSESFNMISTRSTSGVTIEVYTFADASVQTDNGVLDGAQHVLRESTLAFQQFESLFGPYPYDRFMVVQGDFPDGMEFSGLVYVSTSWFYGFDGAVTNYLTIISVHEVAHQWWYAKVGNDAANAPWLDEALATYSEYIYYEEFYPDLKNWWWSFRVAPFYPQGNVDSAVYEFTTIRDYINAVYLRGVQMLHNLREDIGTEAFFMLLRDYATTARDDIGTPELFWSLLDSEQFANTSETRNEFLGNPDIFPPAQSE